MKLKKKIHHVFLVCLIILFSGLYPVQAAPLVPKNQLDDVLYASLWTVYNEAHQPDIAYGDSIPAAAFDQLQQLYLINKGLSSLRGLNEFSFSALKELSLSGNRLTNLTSFPASLPALKFLSLANNQLTSLNGLPNSLPNLLEMNLAGNKFTALAAMPQDLPNLFLLDLSENSLTGGRALDDLPVLPELTEFSLSGNGLTSLAGMPPAMRVPSLEVLELDDNDIQSLNTLPDYTALPLLICNLNNNLLTGLDGIERLQSPNNNAGSELNLSIGGNEVDPNDPQNVAILQNYPDIVLVTTVDDEDDTDDDTETDSGGGSGGGSAGNAGALIPGGDNTDYNRTRLQELNSLTETERAAAMFPADTPPVRPDIDSRVTLTAQDGLRLLISPRTMAGEEEAFQFRVAVGTVMTPPQADKSLVILNPVRYQRQFGLEGREEGRVTFRAPVFMSFVVNPTDLPPGTVTSQLGIYRWDPERKDWLRCGGIFDPEAMTLTVPSFHFSTYAVMVETQKKPERISGADRFSTANAVAERGWHAGADTVIIANGYSFADALAAAPLAFKYNAPVLLTEAHLLTPSTREQISRLKPKQILIIGGTGVISQNVQNSLSTLCASDGVIRYAGEDRYETAKVIAEALGTTGQAVVVSGNNAHFADALAVSGYAAYHGVPILYTLQQDIPEATAKALTAQAVTSSIVVGGTGAVADEVVDTLPSAIRYGGKDRFETAVIFGKALQMNFNQIFIATGRDFPDALVTAAYAAQTLSPLLLVDNGVPASVSSFLHANKASIHYLTQIGGEGVITGNQQKLLQDCLR